MNPRAVINWCISYFPSPTLVDLRSYIFSAAGIVRICFFSFSSPLEVDTVESVEYWLIWLLDRAHEMQGCDPSGSLICFPPTPPHLHNKPFDGPVPPTSGPRRQLNQVLLFYSLDEADKRSSLFSTVACRE